MGTTTTNLGLYKPAFGESGFDDEMATSFDTIDTRLGSPAAGIQYADMRGSNSNDGKTPQTAKKDVVSAYDALDSDGGGEIRVISSITGGDIPFWDFTNQDRGLWIIGSNDPNYATPPTGFRQQKPLRLVAWGSREYYGDATGSPFPQTFIAGGSATDNTKPAIAIAGTNKSIYIEGIRAVNLASPVKLGLDASGSGEHWNTAGIKFRGCYFATNSSSTNSLAAVEMGYAYWTWFEHCTLGSSPFNSTLSAAALVSGTTYTFTVTSTAHLAIGDKVLVTGVTPAGYNGMWDVLTIPSGTTFTANIGTNPAALSVAGVMRLLMGSRRAAVRFGGVPSEVDSGLVFFRDCTFAGAGLRAEIAGSFSWGSLVLDNILMEGDFTNEQPPAFELLSAAASGGFLSSTGAGFVRLENVQAADGLWSNGVIRTIDATPDDRLVTVVSSAEVIGPHTNIGSTLHTMQGDVSGFPIGRERRVHGVTGHATGGPAAARYVNLAPQLASGWSSATGSATVTASIADPYGGTNAATLTSAGANERKIYNASRTVNVGDWFVAGCWVRSAAYPSDERPLVFGFAETDFDFDENDSNTYGVVVERLTDDDWRWVVMAAKVGAIGSNPTDTFLQFPTQAGTSVTYAFPVLNHIPVADGFSDSDIREYRDRLVPYSHLAVKGDVAVPNGKALSLDGLRLTPCTGTPEGAVTAPVGSLALRTDGGASTTLYVKQSGTGNTGWVAK